MRIRDSYWSWVIALAVVFHFIWGFVIASYVWSCIHDRVTAQHRIELECMKRGDC
jgi:hypothetical protein